MILPTVGPLARLWVLRLRGASAFAKRLPRRASTEPLGVEPLAGGRGFAKAPRVARGSRLESCREKRRFARAARFPTSRNDQSAGAAETQAKT